MINLNYAVGISMLVTLGNGVLSWGLLKKVSETSSIALEGDAKHLLSDVVSSVGVAAGLLIGLYVDYPILDPLMALIVSLLVLRMGVGLILKSSTGLMDESCDETDEKIRSIMDRHESRFVDYHNLKTRKSGDKVFTELHLSIDGETSVREAHDFTEHLEEDIQ